MITSWLLVIAPWKRHQNDGIEQTLLMVVISCCYDIWFKRYSQKYGFVSMNRKRLEICFRFLDGLAYVHFCLQTQFIYIVMWSMEFLSCFHCKKPKLGLIIDSRTLEKLVSLFCMYRKPLFWPKMVSFQIFEGSINVLTQLGICSNYYQMKEKDPYFVPVIFFFISI